MTPAIQLLLIQIMQLGVLLAANQRIITFTEISGHVSVISVRIYTAGSSWREGEPNPVLIAEARQRWEPCDWQQETPEKHAQALERIQLKLEFMRAALHGYLPGYNDATADLQEAA